MYRVARIAQAVAVTAATAAAFVVPAQAATPDPFTAFSQPKVSWNDALAPRPFTAFAKPGKHGTPLPFYFDGAY